MGEDLRATRFPRSADEAWHEAARLWADGYQLLARRVSLAERTRNPDVIRRAVRRLVDRMDRREAIRAAAWKKERDRYFRR